MTVGFLPFTDEIDCHSLDIDEITTDSENENDLGNTDNDTGYDVERNTEKPHRKQYDREFFLQGR